MFWEILTTSILGTLTAHGIIRFLWFLEDRFTFRQIENEYKLFIQSMKGKDYDRS